MASLSKDQLMVSLIKVLFAKHVDPDIKQLVMAVAHANDLIDDNEQKTGEYYALMNDELEALIRHMTLSAEENASCACGCGRPLKGRRTHATKACRQKAYKGRKDKLARALKQSDTYSAVTDLQR
jgi:hypothetical protein